MLKVTKLVLFYWVSLFSSTERNQRSKYHERGTSAERRYKRSNRRSPTSSVHRRHHYRHHSHHKRPREHHRHRHRRSSSDRTEDKSPYINNHVSTFCLALYYSIKNRVI